MDHNRDHLKTCHGLYLNYLDAAMNKIRQEIAILEHTQPVQYSDPDAPGKADRLSIFLSGQLKGLSLAAHGFETAHKLLQPTPDPAPKRHGPNPFVDGIEGSISMEEMADRIREKLDSSE